MDTDNMYEPGDVRLNAENAALIIILLLEAERSITAVKVIRDWCDCNLRTAVNMMRSFEEMGGKRSSRIERIAAALPLGRIAEVV